MAYNPLTDFVALLRSTSGGVRSGQMPGLDFAVLALSRMGFFSLSVGFTAPVANQATTVWLKPASPTWSTEGQVFLWNAAVGAYQPATPALWNALLSPSGYVFQSAPNANNVVTAGTSLLAIQRAAPAATAIILPNLITQFNFGKDVNIVDFSTGVINHTITITTPDGSTIMQQNSWELLSAANQLAGIKLNPSPDLNAWVITP